MYLMSTEKQVRLGERKDLKSTMSTAGGTAQCQKCFQTGHWTFECKNERVYMTRPSRTQQLKNPKLRMKHSLPYDLDHPDAKEEKGKLSKKSKRSIDQILILAVIVRLQFSRVIVGLLP